MLDNMHHNFFPNINRHNWNTLNQNACFSFNCLVSIINSIDCIISVNTALLFGLAALNIHAQQHRFIYICLIESVYLGHREPPSLRRWRQTTFVVRISKNGRFKSIVFTFYIDDVIRKAHYLIIKSLNSICLIIWL